MNKNELKEAEKTATPSEAKDSAPVQKPIRGGRNLMILGIASIAIAMITTTISLFIYRATGDIYLDRSRPGFISEGEQHEEDNTEESFSSDGEVTKETYDEYLKELDSIMDRLNGAADSFSGDPLSDESLGIYSDDDASAEEFDEPQLD